MFISIGQNISNKNMLRANVEPGRGLKYILGSSSVHARMARGMRVFYAQLTS